jgi:ligand-binding sensor domain-containing protein
MGNLIQLIRRFIYTVLWMGFAIKAGGQDFKNTRFSTLDGLPSNIVYASFQDKEGFIWMATEFGVSRFDGFTFQNFSQEDGLSDNDVFKIYQDSKSRIWFLTSNGALSYYLDGKIYNHISDRKLGNMVSTSYFNGFIEDKDGNLWFSTFSDGIYILHKNNKIKHLRPLIDLAAITLVPSFWENGKKEVMISGIGGVINLSRSPGVFETMAPPFFKQIEFTTGLDGDQVLMGLQHRLYLSKGPGKEFIEIDSSIFKSDRIISCIQKDKEGNLWVSTLNNLHLFEGSLIDRKHHTFTSKTIQFQAVWLTTKTTIGFRA